jgi:hypothetical protein
MALPFRIKYGYLWSLMSYFLSLALPFPLHRMFHIRTSAVDPPPHKTAQ